MDKAVIHETRDGVAILASSRADADFRWPTVHTHLNEEATMLVVEFVDAHARAAQDRARVALDRVHLTRWAETFITARHGRGKGHR